MRDNAIVSIVDDDESMRLATRSLVQSLGFEVRVFASAEEFLESPAVRESACIISDMNMPGMSGAELQSCLAARGCRAPIIFMTAFPDRAVERRVLKGGAVSYLTKPFEGRALIRCLEQALQRTL